MFSKTICTILTTAFLLRDVEAQAPVQGAPGLKYIGCATHRSGLHGWYLAQPVTGSSISATAEYMRTQDTKEFACGYVQPTQTEPQCVFSLFGLDYSALTIVSDSQCTTPCPGNSEEACGGPFKSDSYQRAFSFYAIEAIVNSSTSETSIRVPPTSTESSTTLSASTTYTDPTVTPSMSTLPTYSGTAVTNSNGSVSTSTYPGGIQPAVTGANETPDAGVPAGTENTAAPVTSTRQIPTAISGVSTTVRSVVVVTPSTTASGSTATNSVITGTGNSSSQLSKFSLFAAILVALRMW
ncbi:hypothetical protein B0O99DRAFT_588631 [Bisporella sp. PMI_857]|nr:hypothetical protein B0O99DRAFT_588631 [Bisporella sp. PMI_857]